MKRPLLIIGVVLIGLGAMGLLYGGITYTKNRESVELGPLDVSVAEKERLTVHPAIGGVMLIAGIGIVVASKRGA